MACSKKEQIDKFLQIAIEEAIEGGSKLKHGYPFGAVICGADGEILVRDHNRAKLEVDPTAHAEVVVIRKAAKKLNRVDLSDCVLYSSGKPCPMCMAAVHWAQIKVVYYASNYEEAEAFGWSDKEFLRRLTDQKEAEKYEKYCPQEDRLKPFEEYKKMDLDSV